MTTLAVITNQGSTRNLRRDNWIDPMLAAEANVVHFKVTRAEQVAEAVAQSAAAGADTIVVNGGDGTADLVFAALLNGSAYLTLPSLALLPAGKTNMTTAGWSSTGTPEMALARILQSRHEGALAQYVVNRAVLCLRQDATTPPLYGAFFGAAEIIDGIHFCRRHIYPLKLPNSLSHMAAMSVLLWRGLLARSDRGAVHISDGGTVIEEGDFFVVAVTALDELLLGLQPATASDEGAEPLHYISLRAGLRPISGMLPALMNRRITSGPGRTVRRMDRLTLRFTGAYTLDGELYEADAAQPLELDGSRRLNFIRIPA